MAASQGPNPVSPPPPGWDPNFDHPADAGRRVLFALITAFASLTTCFFVVRLYAAAWARRMFLDDWACIVSYTIFMIFISTQYMMAYFGAGIHAWEIRQIDYIQFSRWFYACTILYNPMAYATKVTLLLMTARVFAVHPKVAKLIYTIIGVYFIIVLPLQIMKIFICNPISSYWDPSVPRTYCLPQREIMVVDVSIAFTGDIIVLVIPIPLTLALNLPMRKKIRVIALLSLGGTAVVTTAYRVYYQSKIFISTTDATGNWPIISLLSIAEISIGLTCSCLPSVNVLIERWRSRRARRRSSSNVPRTSWSLPGSRRRFWSTITSIWADEYKTENGAGVGAHSHAIRTDANSRCSPTSCPPSSSGDDVDVERAMVTGDMIQMPEPSCSGAANGNALGAGRPPVLSSSEVTCHAGGGGQRDDGDGLDIGSIMKTETVEVSTGLSEDFQREWTGIWDGTSNCRQWVSRGEG